MKACKFCFMWVYNLYKFLTRSSEAVPHRLNLGKIHYLGGGGGGGGGGGWGGGWALVVC